MCTYVFISLECISRRELAGFYVDSMFKILKNRQSVFQIGCIILHSCRICMRVPHLQQHLTLIMAILGGRVSMSLGFDMPLPTD